MAPSSNEADQKLSRRALVRVFAKREREAIFTPFEAVLFAAMIIACACLYGCVTGAISI